MVQYLFVDEPLYVFRHVAFCTDNALSLLEVCSRGAKKKRACGKVFREGTFQVLIQFVTFAI